MQRWGGFLGGVIVGALAGAGGAWLVLQGRSGDDEPAPSSHDGAPSTVMNERRPHLETAGTKPEHEPEPVASAPAPATGSAPEAAATPEDAAKKAYQEALADVRAKLRAIRDAEPGSAPVLELYAALRKQMKSDDKQIARLAGRALMRLAFYGKLRTEEVDVIVADYGALPAGDPGRAPLAATVALAWQRDPKLASWLRELPAQKEPEIRATVVEALDESPSDAYRNYLLQLSRTERDPDVLNEAWSEDPITVALTREWAPQIIAVIEPRVGEGDLPPVVRGRAMFAIGLAAVHDAAGARAALGRMLVAESDEGVRAFGQGVLEAVTREEANVQYLDGLWSKHRGSFGKK